MHQLITRYWDERITELGREMKRAADEQEEIYLRRQIDWMRETRTAVVISEEQGEVATFRQRGLDIAPHRRLIKEGIDLPESMQQKPRFRSLQRMALDGAFKEPEHPFRIAIVCAMWLTGFDVPSLSTLYLDKPLKAHTLMQAIAGQIAFTRTRTTVSSSTTLEYSSTCARHWPRSPEQPMTATRKASKSIPPGRKKSF